MQPLPPNIGRYVVEELVGVGGMGQIYKAQDPVLRRTVAIKLISTKLMSGADRADYIKRFRREAEAAARCAHPNIVAVYDFALHEEQPYLAMEFVAGRSLRQLLDDAPVMDVPDAIAHHAAGPRCADQRARAGRDPPGHQARQHHADPRSAREGGRFRHLEADERRDHDHLLDDRHAVLHVARAVPRRRHRRRPVRHLFGRRHAVRDGRRRTGLPGPQRDRGQPPHPERQLCRSCRPTCATRRPACSWCSSAPWESIRRTASIPAPTWPRPCARCCGRRRPTARASRPRPRVATVVTPRRAARGLRRAQAAPAARSHAAEDGGGEAPDLCRSGRAHPGADSRRARPFRRRPLLRSSRCRCPTRPIASGSCARQRRWRGSVRPRRRRAAHRSATAAAAAAVVSLPEQELERAQAALTQFVGPIARVLVRRAAAKASSVEVLWQALSTHIESPAERAAFLRQRPS